MLTSTNPADVLCPGIAGMVRFLQAHGYETTDSGDGSHYAAGMEGAFAEPMVHVASNPADVVALADQLFAVLSRHGCESFMVQAMYSPNDGSAGVLITGEGLRNWRAE